MFSKMLLVLLLVLPVTVSLQSVYNSQGKPYAKVQQRSRLPIEMIDTVTVEGQYASILLSSVFSNSRHAVAASGPTKVWATITQISTDSTESVRYYSYIVKDRGQRLLIKANNSTDTTKVIVRAWTL